MYRGIGKFNCKVGGIFFLGYFVTVIVVVVVGTLIAGVAGVELTNVAKSWIIWVAIAIPGIIVFLIGSMPPKVFVPMFVIVFGIFLLVSSLQESKVLGDAIKGAFNDINLFSAGVAVTAIGFTFLQLYRKPSSEETEIEKTRTDLGKSEQTVGELEESSSNLEDRMKRINEDVEKIDTSEG